MRKLMRGGHRLLGENRDWGMGSGGGMDFNHNNLSIS